MKTSAKRRKQLREDFLEGILASKTRTSYEHSIRLFEKWLKSPIEEETDLSRKIEKYFVFLKDEGYTQNSRRVLVNGVCQYSKFLGIPINFRKGLQMFRSEISTKNHRLQVSELQKMGDIADIRGQVILELLMMGLRVGDVVLLEWKTFDVLGDEVPIPLEIYTQKEGVTARTFISEEFKTILTKYLPTLDKANKYLLQTARKLHLDEESLNAVLKTLGKKAGIEPRGRFSWHMGRKLFLRTCAEQGINSWNAQMMVGKAVEKSIETYVNGTALKEDFLKVSRVLRLKPEQGNGKISNIQQSIDLLMKVLRTMVEKELGSQGYNIPSQGMGLIVKKSDREILEEYLRNGGT